MVVSRDVDYLIVGAGIIGLAIAHELRARHPHASILVVDKEKEVAAHASGRNSGVLHAGFYYSAESLKAKFCRDGNRLMKEFAARRGIAVNACGKLVVAQSEAEVATIHDLKARGDANGVDVRVVSEAEAAAIDPNVKTTQVALYSPTTATVDPTEICNALLTELREQGVAVWFAHPYRGRVDEHAVRVGSAVIRAGKVINCAGLYADKVAKEFGFCEDYTILPLKGVYLTYRGPTPPVRCCVYPVPIAGGVSLGVHYGVDADGTVRIGPTAIPAFWRENYKGLGRFDLREAAAIMAWEAKLFATNAHGFRDLAISEMKKYSRRYMASKAANLVKEVDVKHFSEWSRPGIRAQLLDKRSGQLVQDFLVEGDAHSVHVLNAVSPAFTSSFAFAKWVVDTHL